MNTLLRHCKNISLTPKTSLDEQVIYWEVLDAELNSWKRNPKHLSVKLKSHIFKNLYPQVFQDLQLLHQANKEIRHMLIS